MACSKESSPQQNSGSRKPGADERGPEPLLQTNSGSSGRIPTYAATTTPVHVETVLAKRAYELKPEDRPALLARYRQEKEVTNKFAATVALGFVGDGETVKEFTNTLMNFQANRPLNSKERSMMFQTIQALGFLAKDYDSAFAFLMKAADPGFWKLEIRWRTEDADYDYTAFAGRALWAIGASQRPEANQIFARLKQQPAIPFSEGGVWRPMTGALVDAVFVHQLIQEKGLDHFKRIYRTHQFMDELDTWLRTPVGQEWREWMTQWEKDHPEARGVRTP